ncbi:beta-xylosidase [Paenibacillus phyllosphaerae]|uniref:Beta-xylosidase n=1 Tax=Paenibacillus phyllosphaerae TaxID=274593 RepID=A0A7W5AYI9_9BACL|nr:LamG-like jellyroll fold domain-containing protein [Paenibacillus phyllosphaerae]MBB3111135.1 beta-xylosidase [Paenibacillus phyllosphaerae]
MKHTMKKYVAGGLILSMLVPGTGFAADSGTTSATSGSDIGGHWAQQAFANWQEQGLIHGYGNGIFKPNQSITRAEFVTLINRVFNFVDKAQVSFSDLPQQNQFHGEFMKAVAAGYLKGYVDGTVRPTQVISRQEAAFMIAQAFALKANAQSTDALKDLNELPAWSKSAVLTLVNGGYIQGLPDGTFSPNHSISRAEALVMLNNVAGTILNKSGTYSDLVAKNVVVNHADTTLKNVTIKGNLYLTPGIAEGDVTLDHVTVEGEIIASGGGENSIHLNDSTIQQIIVNKKNGTIRLVTKGATNIEQVYVLSGVKLEEEASDNGAGFKHIILDEALGSQATIQLAGQFDQVDVRALTAPELKLLSGQIKKLLLEQQATLVVEEKAVIDEVVIETDKTIPVKGKGKVNSSDSKLVREEAVKGEETPSVIITTPSTGSNSDDDDSDIVAPTYTNVSVHDPSVIKDGQTYYVFGSHIEAAKSTDLTNWTRFTNGYTTPDNVLFGNLSENLAGSFAWAGEDDSDSKGGFAIWAPDVYWNSEYVNEDNTKGAYMMYYSASSTYMRSAIGYAVSKTIEGPYTYVDTIIYTGFTENEAYDTNSTVNKKWDNTNIKSLIDEGDITEVDEDWFSDGAYNNYEYPNAIDATLFEDKEGKLWMTYGSWSGGIFVLELDPVTGQPKYPGVDGETEDGRMIDRYFGTKIAGGYYKSGEGPFIVYDKSSGYYFLNVTYGGLASNGGYNMRQFRATNPDGPYVDVAGKDAVLPEKTENTAYGNKLIGNFLFQREIGDPGTGLGYGYVSPGHNSVYYDEAADKHFLFFHARFPQQGELHELRVHQQFLNKDGWLVTAPLRYGGETLGKVKKSDIDGDYKFVNHGLAYSGAITKSVDIDLASNGVITGGVNGSWTLSNNYQAHITIDGVDYEGVFIKGWDETQNGVTMTFTGISKAGETIWGIRQKDLTDKEIVADIEEALTLGDTSKIMSNLTLPTTGMRNATIEWSTSDADVVTAAGVVSPPAANEEVKTAKLTATITKGSKTASKSFEITVVPVDLTDGLVAQYSFENNLDSSYGESVEGTVTGDRLDKNEGGTIAYAAGAAGQSAVFNGSSGIRLPDGLIADDTYSVSFWMNPEEYTQYTPAFFGAKSGTSWISLVPQSWDNNTMLWSGSEKWYDAATGLRNRVQEWHHIAFTVDQGSVKVYVDGVQKYAGTNFPDVFTTDNGVFGLGVNYWDKPFKGMMDEVRIYDLPITQEVVTALADELTPVAEDTEAQLSAQYSFENDLTDTTGNFGAGTVVGGKIDTVNKGEITYAEGVQGDAAVFNGESGVVLPSGLINSRNYSVAMWINAAELKTYSPAFFAARTNTNWINFQPMGDASVNLTSMLWSGYGDNRYVAGTGVDTTLNQWTHMAFTVNDGVLKVYVNGEETFSGTDFPDIFTTDNGTFSLGVNWWDTPFKGMLDELQVYTGVLTSDEVAALAAAPTVQP